MPNVTDQIISSIFQNMSAATDRALGARYGIEFCYDNPVPLDTEAKLKFANQVARQIGYPPWRFGDSCWYRPAT